MKRICRFFALVAAILFVHADLHAQSADPEPCGTRGLTPWFNQYRQHRKAVADQNVDTTWLFVPVTLHITGTSAGSGYYPFDQAMVSLCGMNEKFAPAHIRFYLAPDEPVRYLDNTAWHRHDYTSGGEMVSENFLPARLNMFVVADPAGNCGYSGFDVIVLGQNCSGVGFTTWPHEAGHHFSLPHTFFGWEGTTYTSPEPAPVETNGWPVENADQSNCGDAGDFFCDTKPDYLSARWNCNGNGESPALLVDPLRNPFRADGTLLMGYADQACRARFTVEQIAAMRENLNTEHADYLQWPTPGDSLLNPTVSLISPIDSQVVQYSMASFSWKPVPDAAVYYLEIARNAAFSPVQYRATVSGTTQYAFAKPLINNNLLYWRVRAYHANDPCPSEAPVQTGVFRTKNLNVATTNALAAELTLELLGNPCLSGTNAALQITAEKRLTVLLQLHDSTGRLCSSQSTVLTAGENQWPLDTQGLPPGFYFVSLQAASGILTTTLVIR